MADQGTQAPTLTIGTDPWSAAIGLVDTGLSYFGQSQTNRMQREMHDDEMRLNQQEFEASRSDQMDQARINREFNHDEAQIAREYESLPEKLHRSRSMGVSDWAALGQPGQMASASSQSGISPGFPGMPGIPQLHNPFASGNFTGNIKSLADSLKSVKEAGKAGAETDKLYSMLGLDIANANAQLEEKQIANALQYTWGHLRNAAELKETFARTASLYKQADLFAKQGQREEAEARLADARTETEKVIKGLRENERDIAKKELDSFEEQKRHEWNKMDSEASLNYSESELNRENVNRIHELLPGEKNRQVVEQALMNAETSATWEQISKSAVERLKIARELAILSLQAQHMTLEVNQIKMYQARYKEILDNAIEMDRRTNNQLRQDYHNIFKYVGSLLGGAGAAAVTQAGQVKPGPVQVSGFRP